MANFAAFGDDRPGDLICLHAVLLALQNKEKHRLAVTYYMI